MDKADEWMLLYWHLVRRESLLGRRLLRVADIPNAIMYFIGFEKSRGSEHDPAAFQKNLKRLKRTTERPANNDRPTYSYTSRLVEMWLPTIGVPVCPPMANDNPFSYGPSCRCARSFG
jgi:hypothetical protein